MLLAELELHLQVARGSLPEDLRGRQVQVREPFAALDEQSRMVLGEDLSGLLAQTSGGAASGAPS